MNIPSLEYCSLHYLNQWLSRDYYYHEAANTNIKNRHDRIRQAANFYGIARNLPILKNEKPRYEKLIKILDQIKKTDFQEKNLVSNIEHKAEEIATAYETSKKVKSLTTKFLWMKIKSPIIIYDSQARKALGLKKDSLPNFYERWKDEFSREQTNIIKACQKLPGIYKYAIDSELGNESYIKEISSENWFHERVFDIYLWHIGK